MILQIYIIWYPGLHRDTPGLPYPMTDAKFNRGRQLIKTAALWDFQFLTMASGMAL